MISMDAKWFSAIYSLTDNSLFIIDLQFTSLSKDKLKEHTDKFYALSKIHFAYKPKKVNYITDKIPSKTDGAELYINFLFNYITGQTLSKIKFSSDEKKYFRRKLVWAAILMHEIEDEEEKQDDPPLKS